MENVFYLLQSFWGELVNNFLTNAYSITVYAIIIAVYCIIILYYYKFLSKRDFFHHSKQKEGRISALVVLLGDLGTALKYIVFFPLISFVFFFGLAVMLFILAKDQPVHFLLLMAAAVISAARITAYYSQELAENIANLIPFFLLGMIIIEANFFSMEILVERVMALPAFVVQIVSFILYFLVLELGLRIIYSIKIFIFGKEEEKDVQKKVLLIKLQKAPQEGKLAAKEEKRPYPDPWEKKVHNAPNEEPYKY